jgi:hypothetical protein
MNAAGNRRETMSTTRTLTDALTSLKADGFILIERPTGYAVKHGGKDAGFVKDGEIEEVLASGSTTGTFGRVTVRQGAFRACVRGDR